MVSNTSLQLIPAVRTDFKKIFDISPFSQSLLDSKMWFTKATDKIPKKRNIYIYIYSKPEGLLLLIQDIRKKRFHSISIHWILIWMKGNGSLLCQLMGLVISNSKGTFEPPVKIFLTQLTVTCSWSIIKTLEKDVKYVQS